MANTPDNRSAKSSRSGKSGISRTSISIKLPHSENEEVKLNGSGAFHKVPLQTELTELNEPLAPPPTTHETQRITGRSLAPPETGNNAPPGTPTKPMPHHIYNKDEMRRILAAQTIERAWMSCRDRQMFRLLKHAVCAAEHSLSYEILRKVCPKEAEFLKDKSLSTKVRFRFGGLEFPPMIYFKVYAVTSKGMTVKYLSGKKMIQPASEAAQDALELMGNRKFLDQVIQDAIHYEAHGVTDEVDVTTLKDYMQYLSRLDELPAYMGGRDNSWRKLTLEDLPRQTIFYDIVDFLYSRVMSPRLVEELPTLLLQPTSQETQHEHIRIISTLRPVPPPNVPKSKGRPNSANITARGSKQAKQRAYRMKRMYETRKDGEGRQSEGSRREFDEDKMSFVFGEGTVVNEDEEEWEQEAGKLYEWTQELSYDDIVATPRLHTAIKQSC